MRVTPTDLDLLRGAWLESREIQRKAWEALIEAEIADSGLRVGDRFATRETYVASGLGVARKGEEKIYEVTSMWVDYRPWYGMDRAKEGGDFHVKAKALPVKKDGTISQKGEFNIWNVEAALKSEQIRLVK